MMPEQLPSFWRNKDLQSTSAERRQSNVTEQNWLFITLGAYNGPRETIIIAFSAVLPGGEAGRCCANVSYRGTMATTELHSCVHNPAFSERDPHHRHQQHTLLSCYLCIIWVVKIGSSSRRSVYAGGSPGPGGERMQTSGDSADWPTLHLMCNSWSHLLPERRARFLYLLFVVISDTLGGKRRPNWMEGVETI